MKRRLALGIFLACLLLTQTGGGQVLAAVSAKDKAWMYPFYSTVDTSCSSGSSSTGVSTVGDFDFQGRTLKSGWQPIINKAAQRFNVDPYILAGILLVETGWPDPATEVAYPYGPFAILDIAFKGVSTLPDESYKGSPADLTGSLVVKYGNTNSVNETDGSYIADGDKDGKIRRRDPADAALLSAAIVRELGGTPGLPLGSATDTVGTTKQDVDSGTNTIRKVMAHYNQGGNWSSSRPVQNSAQNNPVKYMQLGGDAAAALATAQWFGVAGATGAAACSSNTLTYGPYRFNPGEIVYDSYNGKQRAVRVNGVSYYSQRNSGGFGGPLTYGNGTIGECGCGPTSIAMIMTTLSGQKATPKEMADLAVSVGSQQSTCGSYGYPMSKAAAAQFGLKMSVIETGGGASGAGNMFNQIRNTLNSGGLVLASMSPSSPFTNAGHYVVIAGIVSEGNQDYFMVADPNDGDVGNGSYLAKSKQKWPLSSLPAWINSGLWAFTK